MEPPSPTATRCAGVALPKDPAVAATATRRSVESLRTCRTDQEAPSRLERTVPADPTAIKASPVQITAWRSLRVPEACRVQTCPSGLARTTPALPTATNCPPPEAIPV